VLGSASQGGRFWQGTRALAPGLAVAGLLALSSLALATVLPAPAVLIGLVLGVLGNAVANESLAPGIAFGGRTVLRLGVALLGAQVTLAQMAALGLGSLAVALASVLVTLPLGVLVARWLGLDRPTALLTSAAVAICGASAALAVAAVLPRGRIPDERVATTVAAITILGSIGMIAYPLIARGIGYSPGQMGVMLGASLHEVVQAVGAGIAQSELAGETAATVKLVRVAGIAPVAIAIAWYMRRTEAAESGELPPALPAFLVGFLILACVSSTLGIPAWLGTGLRDLSRFFLLIGIVALGMRVSLRQLLTMDRRLALAITLQTLIIAAIAFGGVSMLVS
jgi:uncharacterized integral membrane protein (TIGR00698 family)